MAPVFAWLLFALGVGHLVYAAVKFKVPLAEAVSVGFVGQFTSPEVRRTAFWFVIVGPFLMLAGHTAVHAVAAGDLALLRIVGTYTFVTSIVGVAALPKSPFLASLLVSSLLLAAGYGLIE
jgi:hypothetical protein